MTKHGQNGTRLYNIYRGIKNRCYNTNATDYRSHGARGIKVCKEWLDDFINFYQWSHKNNYSDTLLIDRIDNNGNYEPSNCRWTTKSINACNTGVRKTSKTGYRGVYFNNTIKKYQAKIQFEGKTVYLGRFLTAIDGAKAYNRYIVENNLPHIKNSVKEIA